MSITFWDFDQFALDYARSLPTPVAKGVSGSQSAANATNVAKGQQGLAAGTQLAAQGTGIANSLLPAYQQMLKGPSAAETLDTVGGIGATAGAQRDAATRHAASTGNPAAYTAGLDKLAQTQDQTTADAMAKLSTEDRNQALSGLSNMYGVDASTMSKLLQPGGIIPSTTGGFKVGIGPVSASF